jgi:hypothetical protein
VSPFRPTSNNTKSTRNSPKISAGPIGFRFLGIIITPSFHVFHWEGHSEFTPKVAVIGAQVQGCSRIELRPGTHSFGVFFRPAGFSRLIGLPVSELAHRNYDGALISRLFSKLWGQLAECVTFSQRVRVIEKALLSLATSALPPLYNDT